MRLLLMLIPYAALGGLATCAPQPPRYGEGPQPEPCVICAAQSHAATHDTGHAAPVSARTDV